MNPVAYCVWLCQRFGLHGREGAVWAVSAFFREYPRDGCDLDEGIVLDAVAEALPA